MILRQKSHRESMGGLNWRLAAPGRRDTRARPCKARIQQAIHFPRRGFTLVEVLVAIGLIGLLVALILPAVGAARGAARRVQCQNNLRNLALAMQQHSLNARTFPAAGYFSSTNGRMLHSWAVTLLPHIDQAAIHSKWSFETSFRDSPNKELTATHISLLTCPADASVTGAGDLSYVVNGGIGWTGPPCGVHTMLGNIDLAGDGPCVDTAGPNPDRNMRYRLGVYFVDNWPKPNPSFRQHTINSITDGLSNTLMMSENIHTGFDPTADGNWANPFATRNSFFMSPGICRDLSCSAGSVDYRNANDRSGPFRLHSINPPVQIEGESPFASSYHSGGVNVAFLDGRVTFLNEQIDGGVYAALLSPQGSQITGPLAQGIDVNID